MHALRTVVLTATLALIVSLPSRADLLSTPVTGTLSFTGISGNFYDPSLYWGMLVPAGVLNKTQGTTVTISGTQTEFGYADGSNTITANFTGDQLTITDLTTGSNGWTQTFTDPYFAGLTLISSNFSGLSFSSSGNTLQIGWSGVGSQIQAKTYTAVFGVIDPPPVDSVGVAEPASLMTFLGLGALAVFALKRPRSGSAA